MGQLIVASAERCTASTCWPVQSGRLGVAVPGEGAQDACSSQFPGCIAGMQVGVGVGGGEHGNQMAGVDCCATFGVSRMAPSPVSTNLLA